MLVRTLLVFAFEALAALAQYDVEDSADLVEFAQSELRWDDSDLLTYVTVCAMML